MDLEEATPNHLRAGRPYGPRRCGGPEHSAGYLIEKTRDLQRSLDRHRRAATTTGNEVSARLAKRKLLNCKGVAPPIIYLNSDSFRRNACQPNQAASAETRLRPLDFER